MHQRICRSAIFPLFAALACAAATAADTGVRINFDTCAKPEWPKEALRAEQTGRVTLEFRIGADGAILQSQVKQSSGFPLLDEAARTGLLRCQFQPAVVNGSQQAAWLTMQYVWTLEDDESEPEAVKAFEATHALAAQGNVAAQRDLARMYVNGTGVRRSITQAVVWLEKAAAAGDADAQFGLGSLYMPNGDLPANPALAAAWLEQAARQGHLDAQAMLGMYHLGRYQETRDSSAGLEWLRKAAEHGSGIAYALLAHLTEAGLVGVPADPAEAGRLLRKAAELNDHASQNQLGTELLMSDLQKEQVEGVAWLRKALVMGDAATQTMLGVAYRDGRGVVQDYAEARIWFGKAASQSFPDAQHALAAMTEMGLGGRRNKAEALVLYQQAAAGGVPEAARRLAEAFERGDLGDTIDRGRAAECRRKAVELEKNAN